MNLNVLYRIKDRIDDLMFPYSFDLSIYKNIDNQD